MEINNKMQVTIDQLRKAKGIGEKTIERIIEQYAEPSLYDTSYKPYKAHELDYRDENNWLMYGDCLERMREIPDGSVDMIMVDVPYGTTACKWDEIIPLEPMWESINRAVKDNAAIVMTASQPFTSVLITSNLGGHKYNWTWIKNTKLGHLVARHRPLAQSEDICVFGVGKPTYNPQMIPRDAIRVDTKNTSSCVHLGSEKTRVAPKTYTHYHPSTILNVNTVPRPQSAHPTQKPVALMEYLIRTYTDEGEAVLDFTFGSGTTGVACRNLNRKFIGIELDENYYKLGRDRILNGNK